ncbi:MAG TPA: prepilin peptidase [Candidatus Hydrogenedentes bacterium]|nr:prepilin peptidase [Candidatus Hydrogenedentota bacterium]
MVGSFCNVCICRWPAGESVIRPRSRCPQCSSGIAWYDNIPVVSWLLLGAKCRGCGAPISWQYPVVEGITALLFLAVYAWFGFTIATPVYMALCAGLVIVTFVDLREWIIPNEVSIPGIFAGIAVSLLGMAFPEGSALRVVSVFDALAGAALGGLILYLLDRITILILKKPGMGFGDVKLLAMLGAFLGWTGVLGTLMLACILGSAVGLSLIVLEKLGGGTRDKGLGTGEEEQDAHATEKALPGHYIPFGPYLALAGLIFLFFGPEAILAYWAALELPAEELVPILQGL